MKCAFAGILHTLNTSDEDVTASDSVDSFKSSFDKTSEK